MHLGFLTKSERNAAQEAAHALAESTMLRLQPTVMTSHVAGQVKLLLTDCWKAPEVVADVGFVFPRFRQLTGSCVGAGGGQAVFTLGAVQRRLDESPTKAFIPFWPFDYGLCRYEGGMRGPGEGAMGSAFADSVLNDGILDAATEGLPAFTNDDGLILTSRIELQWSDGIKIGQNWKDMAKVHPVGGVAICRNPQDIRAAILNGYPVTFACNNYIGSASVQGSGENAAVCGYWDNRGGHQESVHGYWDNPQLGPLYWVQNNWDGSTYPTDPGGGPVCGCWVTEAHVQRAFALDAEVYAFSHLAWFPAQPAILDWFT